MKDIMPWLPIILQTLTLLGVMGGGYYRTIRQLDRVCAQVESLSEAVNTLNGRIDTVNARVDLLFISQSKEHGG